MTYYNTTKESPRALARYRENAKTQEETILRFFQKNPARSFTPYEVHRALGLRAPITSVRRAMTNLADKGFLDRTKETRPGEYDRSNYCWRLRPILPAKTLDLFTC